MKFLQNNSRFFLVSALLILLVVAGNYFLVQRAHQQNSTLIEETEKVRIQKQDIEQITITSGDIRSSNSRLVFSENTGIVKDILIAENRKVPKGKVIMKIKVLEPQAKTIKVKAPIAGTLTNLHVDVGQPVSAIQSRLFELANLDKLFIEATVVENDVSFIKTRQQARVEITAIDTVFTAKVIKVAKAPIMIEGETTPRYPIELQFSERPLSVRIGMTAEIEIITKRKDSVLAVPELYIFEKDGRSLVKLVGESEGNFSLTDRQITTNFEGTDFTEITNGLLEGDEIVLPQDEISQMREGFGFFQ